MAIPIPRISWGDGYTIEAGVNDLVFFITPPLAGSFIGKIAPGDYATPELLLAAVEVAIEGAENSDGTFAGLGGAASIAVVANHVVVSLIGGIVSGIMVFDAHANASAWSPSYLPNAGVVFITTAGRIYRCASEGTTGTIEPTSEVNPVTDGTVTWEYVGRQTTLDGTAALLGFVGDSVGTKIGGVVTHTAAAAFWTATSGVWSPDVPVRADIEREFESVVTQVETAGGQNKTTRWTPDSLDGRRTYRRVRFAYLKPERVFTDVGGAVALETFWRGGSIGRFIYSPDRDNPAVGARDYFLREASAREFKPRRMFDGVELYEIELEMGLFTE